MCQFVAVLDPDGALLEVNRAALEGVGLTLPAALGKLFWECRWWAVSVETQQRLREAVARAAAGQFVRYDVEIYGREGGAGMILVDFSLTPVADEGGTVMFIVAECRDITEKTQRDGQEAAINEALYRVA
jgi:PAS domain S-box-containing protein